MLSINSTLLALPKSLNIRCIRPVVPEPNTPLLICPFLYSPLTISTPLFLIDKAGKIWESNSKLLNVLSCLLCLICLPCLFSFFISVNIFSSISLMLTSKFIA